MTPPTIRAFLCMTLVVALAACGSGGAPAQAPATPAPTARQATAGAAQPTAGPTAQPATTQPATAQPTSGSGIGGPGDYTPGAVKFRVVNASSNPVDVYVRTQGLVQAYLITEGLASGQSTDYVAPPDPGTLVVTTAGSGKPTCVASCPHFLGTWSTTAGVSDQLTVIIANGQVTDLWEHPRPQDVGQFANAIPAADPAAATFFVLAGAVSGADFGLRLAYPGAAGCQNNATKANILIGGTSVVPFVHPAGTVQVAIHDSTDRDCSATPVGGPFAVAGGAGSRTYLILTGSPGSMKGIVLAIP